jgi:8-oxo-dGTP pyrophosphatase MutT (NUDIX family)
MCPNLTLEAIRAALGARPAARANFDPGALRASVALVLAGEGPALNMVMIRRAEREGDPWSGQMALPGGRAGPDDADAEAVAERETREEVGIALSREQLIAPLDEMPVLRAGVDFGMVLSPFVYYWGMERGTLRKSNEVSAAWWVPLAHLLAPAHATWKTLVRDGRRLEFPAIAHEEEVIWGLTYRVLAAFFERLGLSLPQPP